MKICLFVPSLVSGGAERVITHLANYWANSSHTVYLLTLASPQDPVFYTLDSRIKLLHLDLLPRPENPVKKFYRYLRQIIRVSRVIKRLSPDVVIAFLDISIFLALISKFFTQSQVIVSERNNPFSSVTNKFLKKINLFLYRFADRLIIQTKQLAETFPLYLQEKITVIHNPVLPPSHQVSDYKTAHQQKRVITIGRLHPQKGHDILITAFSQILQNHPDWHLHFIGDGEERQSLENLCQTLDIQSNVRFLGRSTETEKLLAESSIFVLASRYEGFPNALCEAMAVGLPSVATDCLYGPGEIISHKANGLLIPVENAEALAQALEVLITDQTLYRTIGTQAKEITNILAIKNIMLQWEEVITKLSN